MSEFIECEINKGYWVITLNRPKRLNAFNAEQHLALRQTLERARDDKSCRAIVLTGAGRGFCAGQDLSERDPKAMEQGIDLGETLDKYYNPLIRLIRSIPKPIIAAVNGVAAGAGANIAFACDIVLAKKSAKFIQAFCKLGLVPDAGGTWSVTKAVGEARAKGLMLTGMPLMAEKAEEWGLIWQSIEDEKFEAAVTELAEHFATAPTHGLGLTKDVIQQALNNSYDEQLEVERDYQSRAGQSNDYKEGVSAFLEKRAPNFTGE